MFTLLTLYLRAIFDLLFQICVLFPYSALTIPRQRQLHCLAQPPTSSARLPAPSDHPKPSMITEKVYDLCHGAETVSSALAKDPTLAPSDVWKKLYGSHIPTESKAKAREHRDEITADDLKRARECGNWGPTEPSDLFLRLYHDALCTLDKSVSMCMVSPPLLGSCGVIPLTVISVVPDIMRHMSNLIVRADKEVILATNYWQNSVASKYITNAMKELSRRAGERGTKIIFKLEYDRGSPKQLFENHYSVGVKEYTGKSVGIPPPEEIPNIDLEIINYHRPMLGTFHCKYMVVDRKYAILQSNNIQDNDNMEMMIHLEGPIVDSFYDMALISWSKKLNPPLPSHNSPAVQGGLSSFENPSHSKIFGPHGEINGQSTTSHHERLQNQQAYAYEPKELNKPGVIHPDATKADENLTGPSTTEGIIHPVEGQGERSETEKLTEEMDHAKLTDKMESEGHGNEFQSENLKTGEVLSENARAIATTGDVEHMAHSLPRNSDKQPSGAVEPPSGDAKQHGTAGPDSKIEGFLSAGDQALPESQILNPSPATGLLSEHTTDEPQYDADIAGEVARVQTAVSPKSGESRMQAVTRHLNHTKNVGFEGNAPDCAPSEEMTPYVPHPVHEPFPIALVCREPHGPPNHNAVYNPQNEVWLSALRNAKKNVFIQSPTLNAEPLVPAIIAACERGIDVFCYICLGYNDTGELLPMQGGTNEMIANKMYTTLSAAGKQRLHYFFYIGKDQTSPIVAKKKKRDCHIKVMIVDEHIGIQGNGNQDTQSWFHSQEINVMFDSAAVCGAWIDGLRRNQNTHIYGEVSKEDGIWRDEQGQQAADVIGINPGKFSWAKGFMGAVDRVRGTGDF